MYSNVTEMDATIESDKNQNTNSLISSGYFIENYSEDDSDKENKSTNNKDAGIFWTRPKLSKGKEWVVIDRVRVSEVNILQVITPYYVNVFKSSTF